VASRETAARTRKQHCEWRVACNDTLGASKWSAADGQHSLIPRTCSARLRSFLSSSKARHAHGFVLWKTGRVEMQAIIGVYLRPTGDGGEFCAQQAARLDAQPHLISLGQDMASIGCLRPSGPNPSLPFSFPRILPLSFRAPGRVM
jgi:hypothetical protein